MLRTDHGRTSRVPGSATRLRSLFGYRWYRVNHREESVHPGLGVVLSAPRRAPGGVDLTRRSDQARLLFSLLFTMPSQTKLGRRDPLAGHAVMHRAAVCRNRGRCEHALPAGLLRRHRRHRRDRSRRLTVRRERQSTLLGILGNARGDRNPRSWPIRCLPSVLLVAPFARLSVRQSRRNLTSSSSSPSAIDELPAESTSYRVTCDLPDFHKRMNSGHFEDDLV
jgi:hypothetical protein